MYAALLADLLFSRCRGWIPPAASNHATDPGYHICYVLFCFSVLSKYKACPQMHHVFHWKLASAPHGKQ